SQINGCSYCVDEHARDLRRAGESNERLDGLAARRESPYFTQAEKAALEWAEALTRVEQTHAPDPAYEPLARHYDRQASRQHHLRDCAYERLEPRRHRFPRGAQAPSRGAPFRVSAVQACYVSARGHLLDASTKPI